MTTRESAGSRGSLAAYGAFAGCSAIWGSTFLFISIGNDSLPPFWAAALRLGLAAILLVALARLRGQSLPRGPALRAAAAFGFFNFGLSFCLLYWGEKVVPSGSSAVLYATIPLTTALFARALGLERLNPATIAGAVAALAGVFVMFGAQIADRLSPVPFAAILLAATSASFSGVMLKRGPRQPPLGANAAGAGVGFGVCLVASLLAREPRPLPVTPQALIPLLYLTLAGSVGAFVLYAWLVNRWDVTRISFIAVIVPVVAVALGASVRHERLTSASLVGSFFVMLGVLLGLRGGPGGRPG